MAKPRTRLCSNCHRQQRTGNAYCKNCDAQRKAEARGKVALPETEEEQAIRTTVDRTFDLLDDVPGAEVEVKGPSDSERIKVKSVGGGQVQFALKNRQQRRLAEWVERHQKGA